MDVLDINPEIRLQMFKQAVEPLWRRGNLKFKLTDAQVNIREAIAGCTKRKFFLLCSRRFGKSFILVAYCFEVCIKKPGARVMYLAPWAKDAADIAGDIAQTIMEDMPEDLKPHYDGQARAFKFPNGSIIRFRGVNGETANSLRGGATDLAVLDECGMMDNLKYVVSSVVMPMLMTVPGSRMILATTPAPSPGHDSKAIYDECADQGATAKFTLLDNTRVDDAIKGEFLLEAGESAEDIPRILAGEMAPKGTTALREYFVEWVTDAATAVIKEWTDEKARKCVYIPPRPAHFDCYTAIDPGFNDKTGILYAYWDFVNAKLVIEDESLLHQASTLEIGDEIQRKEADLWGAKTPYTRVSDIDLRLIHDLWASHKLNFVKADKQNSLDAINLVRTMVQQDQIVINPRCTNLIRQMREATWNRKATDFDRAGSTSPDGHYDLVAALKYLCRTVNQSKNPYPDGYFMNHAPGAFRSPKGFRAPGMGLLTKTPFTKRLTNKK